MEQWILILLAAAHSSRSHLSRHPASLDDRPQATSSTPAPRAAPPAGQAGTRAVARGPDFAGQATAIRRRGMLPLDMVDNSAGLLEPAPGRAGLAPARVSRAPIRRGHAVILVATRLLVGGCASVASACPVGYHDREIADFPVPTPNSNSPPCPGVAPTPAMAAGLIFAALARGVSCPCRSHWHRATRPERRQRRLRQTRPKWGLLGHWWSDGRGGRRHAARPGSLEPAGKVTGNYPPCPRGAPRGHAPRARVYA